MAKAAKVTILDPTSLVGDELVPRLAAQAPEVSRQYFHSQASGDHLIVEVGGEAAVVAPLTDVGELEDAGLVVITDNPAKSLGQKLADFLTAHPEIPCVDLSRPGVLPGPPAFWPLPGENRLLFPDPALILPAMVLRALAPLNPRRAFFSVLSPVSTLGGEAVDELAAQAVARLSGEKPKTRVLPTVMAFDAFPYPERDFGRLESQLAAMFPQVEMGFHSIFAGVFHAHAAHATVTLASPAREAQVRELLLEAGFVPHRGRKPLTPSQGAGQDQAIAWVLATRGETVSLWAVGDHLLLQAKTACEAVLQLLATSPAA